jgi:TIR domain
MRLVKGCSKLRASAAQANRDCLDRMRIFISYTRTDAAEVHPLVVDIQRLGHEVWIDQELTGGQNWWDTILSRIRSCDVFVVAMSPAWLQSEACSREYAYAASTLRIVLPVVVRSGASPRLMSPELAQSQQVNYSDRTVEAGISLARALSTVGVSPALPSPLPPPPEVPISYLNELSTVIHSSQPMSREQQLDVLARLRSQSISADEQADVQQLLTDFRRRPDLLATVAADIDVSLRAWAAPGERTAFSPPVVTTPIATLAPQFVQQPTQMAPGFSAVTPNLAGYQGPTDPGHGSAQYIAPSPTPGKPAWSTGEFIGYLALAFLCALPGLIVGIVQLKNPARKSQATVVIILAAVMMFFGLMIAAANNSSTG